MAKRRFVKNHIVLTTPVNFKQAEFRFCPVDTIAAFAIPGDFRSVPVKLRSASIPRVQPKQVAVPDDSPVFQRISRLSHWSGGLGGVQSERCIVEPIDQKAIHKQLATVSDIPHCSDLRFKPRAR